MERLDKVVSEYSDYSRKDVRRLIREKRVTINGVLASSFDQKVNEEDKVAVDGESVLRWRRILAILNKPKGFVTSTEDPRDRTVMELVPDEWKKLSVFPVGRLDKDGLLVFTNDGALAHYLISPKSGIEKEYYVEHTGSADENDIAAFKDGLVLDGEKLKGGILIPLESGRSRVIIFEGRYHQVRRMMASRGMDVTYLKRIREGNLTLDGLESGRWRELGEEEEILLKQSSKT